MPPKADAEAARNRQADVAAYRRAQRRARINDQVTSTGYLPQRDVMNWELERERQGSRTSQTMHTGARPPPPGGVRGRRRGAAGADYRDRSGVLHRGYHSGVTDDIRHDAALGHGRPPSSSQRNRRGGHT